MKRIKYRGRKKYSYEEAGEQIEAIMQQYSTNLECIMYWKMNKRSRTDKLIEALTNKTRSEMIEDNKRSNEYLMSKLEYMRQFAPGYQVKGSFGLV